MKKTTALLLTALLIGSFAGCSQSAADNSAAVSTMQSVASDSSTSTTDSSTEQKDNISSNSQSSVQNSGNANGFTPDKTETSRNANGFTPDADQNSGNVNNFKRDRMNRQNNMNGENGNMTPPDMNGENGNMTPLDMNGENGNMTPPDMNGENGNMTPPDMNSGIGNNANTTTKANVETLSASDIFSDRDLKQTADTSKAKTIQVASGTTQNITEAGVYILSGTATDFTVKVAADKEDKVQLVLDGLNVTNSSFPVIYVVSADKCFITTTNSENSLSVTGTFTADGDTNTDAVIYSKDDVVFNGTGTLNITSAAGNGISGKDDVKFTGGTYSITSKLDSVEANDSIAIYAGSFTINSSKDAFHSENSDDDTVGYVYIADGTFNIKAASDAIQGTTITQIDGGTFTLNAPECIEATYVRINGGTISITSSDDGINASYKSRSCGTPTVEINDGDITIVMGQGDTDGIDANGNIYVNGGTINITAQMSSFDYDGVAEYNGGTIIINGSQVDSIPQSMMGGRGGMGGMGRRGF